MDTVDSVEFNNVKPKIVNNYQGGDIVLNEEKNIVMKESEFPILESYVGDSLVVTDGTTLLGADDKAGIAEIMTAVEKLMTDDSISHGDVCIAFTPDEEIGRGADLFDIKKFGADYAYTVDGGAHGQIEYENFNAVNSRVTFFGKSVHPGDAKNGMMKNALRIAMEFDSLIPQHERPEHTEGYEGFYHLMEAQGDVEKTVLRYILRDHDFVKIKIKRAMLEKCAEFLNTKYGKDTVKCEFVDSYSNMAEYIKPHMHLIDNACDAITESGGQVIMNPIRGGTDGVRLSKMGLPCPNLGTGSENHHGRFEFASVEAMDRCVDTIIKIIEKYR